MEIQRFCTPDCMYELDYSLKDRFLCVLLLVPKVLHRYNHTKVTRSQSEGPPNMKCLALG